MNKWLPLTVFLTLSAFAGGLWSLPIIIISNTGVHGWNSLFLGCLVGFIMGVVIYPWIIAASPTARKIALLALLTYVLGLPLFLIMSDAMQTNPVFAHDFLSSLIMLPRMALYSLLPQFSALLLPLAFLTVYGLWHLHAKMRSDDSGMSFNKSEKIH
jgi:hypothetical protein